ncbi:hypothetical protein BMR85_027435 [Achromobacter sp. KAs 3-5]|nr:hypothetical protein BMR85_027435 [Achromobacter sp. KAs 3-5]
MTEDSSVEREAMSRVAAMLDFVAGLEDTVEGAREVVPGSSFAADDHLCPSHPTSQSVHHLLMSAHGSLAALSRALDYRRSNERMDMTLDLYGVYDLVRNALESGSWALWIAAPYASRRRVRRSLILLEDEHRKHVSARAALGLPDADVTRMKQAQSSRLAAYIEHSGVRPWVEARTVPRASGATIPFRPRRCSRLLAITLPSSSTRPTSQRGRSRQVWRTVGSGPSTSSVSGAT